MIEINLTPKLIAALGFPEGETITAESFLAALQAKLSEEPAEATATAESAAQIADLTAKLAAAEGKLAEIENAKTMAEVDALLADYELPEVSAAAMRDLATNNRDQAKALLAAMPKKAAKVEAAPVAKTETVPPPASVHQPGKVDEPKTAEDKARAADALITTVRKEGKFTDYSSAREEARRRKPELFS